MLCQTISPAQYRTPALYEPHYIGPPTVCHFFLYPNRAKLIKKVIFMWCEFCACCGQAVEKLQLN